MRLSLATIAWNEQDLIGPMLDSVAGIVDEVVIGIDDKTTDATAEIVTQHGGKVIPIVWTDDFAAARNQVLAHTTGDWILALDADERLTHIGRSVIADIKARADSHQTMRTVTGFQFLHANLSLESDLYNVVQGATRMFRNQSSIRYRGLAHEEVWLDPLAGEPYWVAVSGIVVIMHVGYDPSLWIGRGKHERLIRLLQRRLELDPTDEYARHKLVEELALDAQGYST